MLNTDVERKSSDGCIAGLYGANLMARVERAGDLTHRGRTMFRGLAAKIVYKRVQTPTGEILRLALHNFGTEAGFQTTVLPVGE